MSIHALNAVWRSGIEDRSQLLFLLALADWADDSGHVRFAPSERVVLQDIADKARMTDRTARTALRALEAEGIVETREMEVGRYGWNAYRIRLEALPGKGGKSFPLVDKSENGPVDNVEKAENDDRKGGNPRPERRKSTTGKAENDDRNEAGILIGDGIDGEGTVPDGRARARGAGQRSTKGGDGFQRRDPDHVPEGLEFEPEDWRTACELADALEAPCRFTIGPAAGPVCEPGGIRRAVGLAYRLEEFGEDTLRRAVRYVTTQRATDRPGEIWAKLRKHPDWTLPGPTGADSLAEAVRLSVTEEGFSRASKKALVEARKFRKETVGNPGARAKRGRKGCGW